VNGEKVTLDEMFYQMGVISIDGFDLRGLVLRDLLAMGRGRGQE